LWGGFCAWLTLVANEPILLQQLTNRDVGSFSTIYERFVIDRAFEAHRSRILLGDWRQVSEAGRARLRSSLLSLSKNPALPITNKANLLTGYVKAQTAMLIPQSWLKAGKLICPSHLTFSSQK
jgi:hypothetical protein